MPRLKKKIKAGTAKNSRGGRKEGETVGRERQKRERWFVRKTRRKREMENKRKEN